MKVWFVDDQASNREHWRRSFPAGIAGLELRTFRDVDAVLDALAVETPDILFVDYYLGDRTGQEVVDRARGSAQSRARGSAQSRARGGNGPVVIAHSSLSSASMRMVEGGADFAVPKEKAGGVIRAVADAIRSGADLEAIVRTRRWPR